MELNTDPLGAPPPRASANRSRRQRKKLFLGEFQQLGFHAAFSVAPALSFAAKDALYDRFISEAVVANGLSCGGGGSWDYLHFFVTDSRNRRVVSATPTQRQAVSDWLASQSPQVVEFVVSDLVDANYDPPVA